MKVVIEKRKLPSGEISLYLRYRKDGKRYRELMELYLLPGERQHNKDTLILAETIRAQRDHEIKSGNFGLISMHKKKMNFFKYAEGFTESYKNKDINTYKASVEMFKKFLGSDDIPCTVIPCSAIGDHLMKKYYEYLKEKRKGETPYNYFKAIKRILKQATEDGLFRKNPADGIRCVRKSELTKEVLMDDEIQLLAKTMCGNPEIKRAFLFSTQTGLRRCDVVRLKWKNVFISLGYIDFEQVKIDNKKTTVPLNDNAIKLLGDPGDPDEFVFHLPSTHNDVNKVIRNWVKRAGITKHITYHCARHSLGTNLLIHGIDLKTASMTLGHSSTKQTEKYTRISDAMKQRAVNKLPAIKF